MRDKDWIVQFIERLGIASRDGIVRHMYNEHGVEPHTTRCYLWQLVNDDDVLDQDGKRYSLAEEVEETEDNWNSWDGAE